MGGTRPANDLDTGGRRNSDEIRLDLDSIGERDEHRKDSILDASALARRPMNQEEFDSKFEYQDLQEDEFKLHLKKFTRKYTYPFTSCAAFKQTLFAFIPILDWLPRYSLKWLLPDGIGGLTVGVMHVPQGIAYALLAKQAAVNGLYTSFLPPLVYTIFGTSRHNSIGSFAVVSLMCGMAVVRLVGDPSDINWRNGTMTGDTMVDAMPGEIASTLTLLVGFMQLLMALLRLDFMTTYFSDQVVAGFTTGASVHVFVSQLKDFFGYKGLPRRDGAGSLVLAVYDIARNIPNANPWTCGIALVSMAFLILGKDVISPLLKKHCNFSISLPYELALIIISTALSFFCNFHDNWHVKIVGTIPTTPPVPAVPRFDLIPKLLPDALAITVVVVAVHISLAKMFAKKMQYEIDPNQELTALGITSTLSSFFPVYPVACSLGRTLLNVEVGTKTLLSNVFSSLFLLSIILYIGRWFGPLPMPVLSAIVIVALKGMCKKFLDLRLLWPISKIDFSIWVVSFAATVFIDVTPGLLISIVYALFTTIMREQWPRWHLLGNVHGTGDFKDYERYGDIYFFRAICIFRFDSPLLFTNVERFKKSIVKAISTWERSHDYYVFRIERTKILREKGGFGDGFSVHGVDLDGEGDDSNEDTMEQGEALSRHFIIDCSGFTFVDYMGVSALKEAYTEMHNRGVRVYFAAAKAPVREMFKSCGFFKTVPKENFYPTIRDAVTIARLRQKARGMQDVQFHLEHDRLTEIMSAQPMD